MYVNPVLLVLQEAVLRPGADERNRVRYAPARSVAMAARRADVAARTRGSRVAR